MRPPTIRMTRIPSVSGWTHRRSLRRAGRTGGLYLENPRENRYDLQADIELEDGTVVYSSPVLEPDSHIDTVDLDEELEDGTYPAQARLFAVDPESGVIVGYVLQPIELRVGNAD